MSPVRRAKVFEYSAELTASGELVAEGRPPLTVDDSWTPEHLLLAAMARCVVQSLRFHARDRTVTVTMQMHSTVTRREEDGLYGMVDAELALDATIDPPVAPADLPALLARAQRGCFVGNSLRVAPRYTWRVNGVEGSPAP